MEETFKPGFPRAPWKVTDSGIIFDKTLFEYANIKSIIIDVNAHCVRFKTSNGQPLNFFFRKDEIEKVESAIEFARKQQSIAYENAHQGIIYSLDGARGRHMDVYEDRVVMSVRVTVGSLLTGNITDGEKEIYYSDVLAVQSKAPTGTLGYIQLETASMMMNNNQDNFFNENTFTYNPGDLPNGLDTEVVKYIKDKVSQCKQAKNVPTVIKELSSADEIKKYKELLDIGAITQEEFDAKKKELLNI